MFAGAAIRRRTTAGASRQLMIDVEDLVHQYDETHAMDQKDHRKTRTHGAGRTITGSNRIAHLRRDVRPSPGRKREFTSL